MITLPNTDLEVFPLCLGGNTFGWTSDADTSMGVLDEYCAHGGNFIDTADQYSTWVPGNAGGESETIIGEWLARRGRRDELVIATKVGHHPEFSGLNETTLRSALHGSLSRLQLDYVDILYAHVDDPATPIDETLGVFQDFISQGLVRHVAASNFTAERLTDALAYAEGKDLPSYVVLQTHYNLMERRAYETELRPAVAGNGLGCLPYYSLASGFLTGKYGAGYDFDGPRSGRAMTYLTDRGFRVLDALTKVSQETSLPVAAVALGWLAAQPTVVAPVASARNANQLLELLPFTSMKLDEDAVRMLSAASEWSEDVQ